MSNPLPTYTELMDIYAHGAAFAVGNTIPDSHSDPRILERLAKQAVPFDFSDVGDEVVERINESDRTNDFNDVFMRWLANLPVCVPPYSVIAAELTSDRDDYFRDTMGLIETTRQDDGSFVSVIYPHLMLENRQGEKAVMGPVSIATMRFDPAGRLITETKAYADGRVEHNVPYVRLSIMEKEDLLTNLQNLGIVRPGESIDSYDPEEISEYYTDRFLVQTFALAAYVLYGCSILHCKNVEEKDRRLPRQQARLRARQSRPEIVWKTLVVRPMRKPRSADETLSLVNETHKKRLHSVRGHFSEYGPTYGKGLLFGKYEGQFFVPGHWRGLAEIGTVLKTYDVRKPLLDSEKEAS